MENKKNTSPPPIISVIMPVFNGEKYLSEAIESILGQTYNAFEFIIINDGSTDGSEEIIYSYKDQRIRYVKNEKNLNIGQSLNKGIDLALGKYIARMDADDSALPSRLKRQLEYMENNPEIDVLFSCIKNMDAFGLLSNSPTLDAFAYSEAEIRNTLPKRNCLAHPTLFIKTALLKKYKYRPEIKSEDWDLWLRLISDKHRIHKIRDTLLYYREHEGSLYSKFKTVHRLNILRDLARFSFSRLAKGKFGAIEIGVIKTMAKTLCSGIIELFLLYGSSAYRTILLLLKSGADKWNGAVIFFFFGYDISGSNIVHLDILRRVYPQKKVYLVFHKGSADKNKKHLLNQFKNLSTAHYIMPPPAFFRKIILFAFKIKLRICPKTTLFGVTSPLFYELAKNADKHQKIHLIHAFGDGDESNTLKIVNQLDQRIVVNKDTAEKIKKQYAEAGIDPVFLDRIRCIPNGISLPGNYSQGKDFSRLNLLFVGRNAPEKRIHIIEKTLHKLIENKVDFTFSAAGGDFHLCTAFLGIEQVKCLGKINREDLAGIYRQANVLLISSEREGFPMVIMEAMGQGTVPVSTDVGGISEYITHLQNGILIPNHQEENKIIE